MRERICLDEAWQFALGNASSPASDFGCGTEYFNYLTKAASIHNEGPYALKFDASSWETVDLPHDWVVDLPYAAEASHSHGYKTIGYKYPETSVGWYRKTISIPASDFGKHLYLQFDGIFRDARIWVNGFFLGEEPSGYVTQVYDITDYLNYGGENLIVVRVDASLEEGWFYEGAGIYRHVWLNKTAPVHVAPFGTFVSSDLSASLDEAKVSVQTTVVNDGIKEGTYRLNHLLKTADGRVIASVGNEEQPLQAKAQSVSTIQFTVDTPELWDVDRPYLYQLVTEVYQGVNLVDSYTTPFGIRQAVFDADKGFILNGKPLKLKGVNMHQDHAGVGVAIPDALQEYRLKQLKKFGCNAYRASHNPMTPEMLDACDREGILVIAENRLMGVNPYQLGVLGRMIERDRNHPSIILWSVGNEEWGIEWNEKGERISASMREYCHRLDSTRLMTVASSSGPTVLVPADVAGYNYILQHPVDEHRANYPKRCAVGSEETSGCGTRNIYFDEAEKGWMASLNRKPNGKDSLLNCIERGWKFYDERPWLGGLFYWTGFDYRGEPNPLKFPATGSQFGILDYCGFPKDEAYYLKAWWTDEPVLHILPHWNLKGHEGDSIDVWVYSNCEEVELLVNGKNLGKQPMPKNGHLAWKAIYQPGKVKAVGYRNGRRCMTQEIETTGEGQQIRVTVDRLEIRADKKDVAVACVEILDKKGRVVPTACESLNLEVAGPVRILGVGNGNPAFQEKERPEEAEARIFSVDTFNGLAQVLLQSTGEAGEAILTVRSGNLKEGQVTIQLKP
jgi:beta-galactosidase